MARYSDIISLLTITVREESNKHCLLPFFIISSSDLNLLRKKLVKQKIKNDGLSKGTEKIHIS